MNIKLNVTEKTFVSYLSEEGYNYSIKQFEDMISTIRRITILKIKNAIDNNNLETIVNYIFEKSIDILILANPNKIKSISSRYLISMIEDGELDLFLLDKNSRFSDKTQENAYRLSILENLQIRKGSENILTILTEKYPFLIKNRSSKRLSAIKCLNSKRYNLTEKRKSEIDIELNEYIKKILFKHKELENLEFDLTLLSFPAELYRYNFIDKITGKKHVKDIFLEEFLNEEIEKIDFFSSEIEQIKISYLCMNIDTRSSYHDASEIKKDLNLNIHQVIEKIDYLKKVENSQIPIIAKAIGSNIRNVENLINISRKFREVDIKKSFIKISINNKEKIYSLQELFDKKYPKDYNGDN